MRQLTPLLPLLSAVSLAAPAHAHSAGTHAGLAWSFEPWVVVSLVAAALVYALGVRRAAKRAGSGRVFRRLQIGTFAGGMAALVIALLSPVDTVGAQLFSVHMVQHLVLMLVAAPLLVWGRPMLAALWAVPAPMRRSVGRWWAASMPGRIFSILTHALSVWIIYCGVFIFWHIPGPYRWAVQSEVVHALEHVTILVSAFLFWSVVIEPAGRRRLDHGGRLLFVATAAVLGGLPGALMILSPLPLYPVHGETVAWWGLTLLEDQQLAGLIMWIPAGSIYLIAASVLFLLWLRDAEQRAGARHERFARTLARGAAPLLLAFVVIGCEPEAERWPENFGGNPDRGAERITSIGCGSCHIIPGIAGAKGLVGPPLNHMGSRIYIAGLLRNTPANMMYWLQNPQRVVPGNAMPDMGLNEEQARDIAAYLYTLE